MAEELYRRRSRLGHLLWPRRWRQRAGVVLLALIVLAYLGGLWLSLRPVVADNYQQKVTTGGSLEARYLAAGPHAGRQPQPLAQTAVA